MKIFPVLLAGSLALNAALLAMMIAGAISGASSSTASMRPDAPKPKAIPPTAPGTDTWARLHIGDPAALRERLRAEGFPPSVIRTILAAQIRTGFGARRKALDAMRGEVPFWEAFTPSSKLFAEYAALNIEELKTLRALLGPDPNHPTAADFRRQLPNLSDDKIEQLADIRDRYNQQMQDISLRGTGTETLSPDDRAQLAALRNAMHAEFATVLTPDELTDYDLRTSNTANSLRSRLSAFDPTEQEFRSLYQLQSAFDDQYQFTGLPTPDQIRARNDAQKALDDQIADTLGPDRYADYQRSNNYDFRQTNQLVARLELPPDAANQVYAVQQDITQRAHDVGLAPGPKPSVEEMQQQLTVLGDEARTRISALLGPAGYEAYRQYGGQWMQRVRLRTTPAPEN
jgi:hypothetical protein